jgi:hypothetical protein
MRRQLAVLFIAMVVLGGFAVAQSGAEARFQASFENDRAAAFTLELALHQHAQIYQFSHDTVWLALSDATVSFAQNQQTSFKVQFKTGDTRFFSSFQAKSVLNDGTTSFRAVLVEIKGRGLAAGGCGCLGEVEKAVCGCTNSTHLPELWAVGFGQLTLGGTSLQANEGFRAASPRNDMLLIAITDVELRDDASDAAEPPVIRLKSGDVTWVKEGRHRFKNVGAQGARFVTLEF